MEERLKEFLSKTRNGLIWEEALEKFIKEEIHLAEKTIMEKAVACVPKKAMTSSNKEANYYEAGWNNCREETLSKLKQIVCN